MFKLRDFIDINKLNWSKLCENSSLGAIQLLEKNIDKIDWRILSSNPNAIDLLEKYPDKINVIELAKNPNAIHLIKKFIKEQHMAIYFSDFRYNLVTNPNAITIFEENINFIDWSSLAFNPNPKIIELYEKYSIVGFWPKLSKHPILYKLLIEKHHEQIDWMYLSQNPNVIDLLEKNLDKVDWRWISCNPNAIRILEKNPNKIYWNFLCENPNGIDILEKNIDKISWSRLSKNPHAICILEKNLHKVDWENLSENPNAIHILEKNIKNINWYYISSNPSIFTYDYEAMKSKRYSCNIYKEFIETMFHPRNFNKWKGWGYDENL